MLPCKVGKVSLQYGQFMLIFLCCWYQESEPSENTKISLVALHKTIPAIVFENRKVAQQNFSSCHRESLIMTGSTWLESLEASSPPS
mmetsp:Transcript_1754/g.3645  ORF Transcript_1754/g.3645 Transcript_1754/m.3645 type:complete len:87 (+) Transcript_1754:200-460(+)